MTFLHSKEVGRCIGEENRNVSKDELADIITQVFIWSPFGLYGCIIN